MFPLPLAPLCVLGVWGWGAHGGTAFKQLRPALWIGARLRPGAVGTPLGNVPDRAGPCASGGVAGVRPDEVELREGAEGTFGGHALFGAAARQELLECAHSKEHVCWGGGGAGAAGCSPRL